jgi:hypothetical protein
MEFQGSWTRLTEAWFGILINLASLITLILHPSFTWIAFLVTIVIINSLFFIQFYSLFYWVILGKDHLLIKHGINGSISHKYLFSEILKIQIKNVHQFGRVITIYKRGNKKSWGIDSLSGQEIDRLTEELIKHDIPTQ